MTAPEVRGFTIGKHRLEALSDGLYAIALTLLVLELKIPSLPHGASDAVLRESLLELVPKVLAWLLSFSVIALFWVFQQRSFLHAKELDQTMVRIELAMLALVSLLPFSTAIIGEYARLVTASALYASHMVAISLLAVVRASYFRRHKELHTPDFTQDVARGLQIRTAVFLASSAATLVLAFFVPRFNMLAMLPAYFSPFVQRRKAPAAAVKV